MKPPFNRQAVGFYNLLGVVDSKKKYLGSLDMKISQTFIWYIKPTLIDFSKRILFMTCILDNFWKILESIQNKKNYFYIASNCPSNHDEQEDVRLGCKLC